MGLKELWQSDPDQFIDKRVDQIISFAGDGKLGDANTAPVEFRGHLARISSRLLARYAEECLEKSFPDSGLALQDIVNEIANRLGFEVEHGRYRGVKNAVGFDGIWQSPEGESIVVEVKTSDAYRMPIETVAAYRRELLNSGRLNESTSSILIVVGREDTGEIEAQIRGSRYAWEVRLISVDALLRLMSIRQEVDDPGTEAQIRSLLIPREFTRLDEIIDVVFYTTEDLLEDQESDVSDDEAEEQQERVKPASFNDSVAGMLSSSLSLNLTRQSRIVYADADAGVIAICAVSKEYSGTSGDSYWFAFHPHQLEKLEAAEKGYAAFGCGSASQIALLPVDYLKSQLPGLHQTVKKGGKMYWHIKIQMVGERWLLHRRKNEDWPDITDKMLFGAQ